MTNHRVRMDWIGEQIDMLEDLVPQNPRLLFIGYNPSLVSLDAGHYHRGTLGRQFWKMLEQWGIVPKPSPGEFHDDLLLLQGDGITDLVKRATPRAISITRDEIEYGGKRLDGIIKRAQPDLICPVYKTTLDPVLGKGYATGRFGLIDKVTLHGSRVFALPFPYRPSEVIQRHMDELRELLAQM